ncbi:activator-dependent family glycosyltransferase [Spirillospora sp. NPDC029432]|uniref:activator-dependent family glycosyltransferase n=1 Tax=Spirillospora sp. NPDC029432 TaxID=3154599 RepID=UPI0034560B12
MRVLIVSHAQDTHFNGAVPLAWALRTAGHEVRVASQPALSGSITGAGLTAVEVGEDPELGLMMGSVGHRMLAMHRDPDYLANRPERLTLEYLQASNTVLAWTFFSQLNNDSMVDDLVDFACSWRPDLVIWEQFTFGGAVAARACGAAHARLLSIADTFHNSRQVFLDKLRQEPPEHFDDTIGEWLSWKLGRFGRTFDEEVMTGQWTIDQLPPSMRLPLGLRTVSMRYVPYNGPTPAVAPRWLDAEPVRPRVCLTLGETLRSIPFPTPISVEDVFEAIADLDIELVATLTAAECAEVSRVPSNTRVVEHVPMHVLLPSCSAIIHHGGAGTWSTAGVCGVPQGATGWVWDTIYRAQRLEDLGAGIHIPASAEFTPDRLREVLISLLEKPSYKENAMRLREEILGCPSPNEVVPVLEELTAAHRSR